MIDLSTFKDMNVIELACKTNARVALNDDEQVQVAQLDEWAREIGNTGRDKDMVIAQFMQKAISDNMDENYPSALLDVMFDRGQVGEFDGVTYWKDPKNTLKAIEAAQGGTVERSYIDGTQLSPVIRNLQIDTGLSFVDLRRNGWKTVALHTQFAQDALNNALFKDLFDSIDSAIVSGAANYIDGGESAVVTQALIDSLSLYVNDWAEGNGAIVGLSKFIQQISKLSGYSGYYSEEMKNTLYRTGELPMYDGINLYRVASNRTLNGDGVTKLLKDKRVYGIAGKVGALDMIGDMHVYEEEDVANEKIRLYFKDFKYARTFYDSGIEKAAKIVLA